MALKNSYMYGVDQPACCDTPSFFDGACYLARYPDVAADGKYNTPVKAFDHWLLYGEAEGRIPGCDIPAGCNCTPIDTGDDGSGGNTGTGILDWIKKNPVIVAGIAGVILFALKKRR